MSALPQSVAPAAPEPLRIDATRELDRCVMCGLCLPYCPTYRYSRREFESPRGRIALLRGVVSGTLEPGPTLIEHLDHCLGCRACERVCPAGVRYGALLDWSHAALRPARPRATRWTGTLLGRVLSKRWVLGALGHGARALRRIGIARAANAHGWRRLAAAFDAPAPAPEHTPARGAERAIVQLFTGCVASVTEADVVRALLRLLPALGYTVEVPRAQVCCGALSWHSGDFDHAQRLLAANERAFAGAGTVLLTATGCLAHLRARAADHPFAARARDAVDFLLETDALDGVTFDALPARVLVHEPCTQAAAGTRRGAVADLVRRIPGVSVETLPAQGRCCGAAGAYLLTEPAFSAALLESLRGEILERRPDVLVTTNTGCALQLRTALSGIEVLHPATLLARQLGPHAP